MTKTQPIQHMELTIGPAAVCSLAADLRHPSVPPSQVHPYLLVDNCLLASARTPHARTRLYVVAANGKTAH